MTQIDKFSPNFAGHVAPPFMDDQDEEPNMPGLLGVIRRRIKMILAIAALVMAVSIPLLLKIRPLYQGESRVLIQSPLATVLAPIAAQPHQPNLDTEVARLLSRDAAVRVIRDLRLDRRLEFNPALAHRSAIIQAITAAGRLFFGGDAPNAAPTDPLDRILPLYYSALKVTANSASGIVQIAFRSHDPELAAEVPNTLLQIYLDQRENYQHQRISDAEAWLSVQIAAQQARVDKAYEAVKTYREKTGLASSGGPAETVKTIADLNERHAALAHQRTELQAALTAMRTAPQQAGELASAPTAVSQLARDLQLEQQKLASLLQTYGENYGQVTAERARIREIQASLGRETARYAGTLRTQLHALDGEDQAVLSQLSTARDTMQHQTVAGTELAGLTRNAETEQAKLDKLTEQRTSLVAEAAVPAVDVETLSPASVPLQPEGRSRLLFLVGAIVAAAGLSLTAAFVREILDKKIRSRQQLRGLPGTDLATMVPSLLAPEARRAVAKEPHPAECGPDGIFADAMLGVRLALERSMGGTMPKSLVVTSALPGEGKSLIASALAVKIAASGQRVLLVDGDLRHGRVHMFFGSDGEPGLTEFLRGECDLERVIRYDPRSRVEYIARGGSSHMPSPERHMIAEIIRWARENGQILIFDSAPSLATAETSLLAELVERTLLVIRWGSTGLRAVEAAVERLRCGVGENVVPVINMVDPRRHALYDFRDAELFRTPVMRYRNNGLRQIPYKP